MLVLMHASQNVWQMYVSLPPILSLLLQFTDHSGQEQYDTSAWLANYF